MASLIKQAGRYYAQFYSKNRKPAKKRISLRTTKKRIAQRIHLDLEEKYALGLFDPWLDQFTDKEEVKRLPDTVGGIIEYYIEVKSKEDWRSVTARNTGYVLKSFAKYVGNEKPINSLSVEQVNDYLNRRNFAFETKKSHRTKVRAFLNWAKSKNVISIDIDGVKIFNSDREQAENINYLSRGEIQKLKSGIERIVEQDLQKGTQKPSRNALWLIDFIDWQRWSGMRISETLSLRVGDVNQVDWVINIGSKHFTTKSKAKQVLPISEVEPLNPNYS